MLVEGTGNKKHYHSSLPLTITLIAVFDQSIVKTAAFEI
jgi:hypothetical protein